MNLEHQYIDFQADSSLPALNVVCYKAVQEKNKVANMNEDKCVFLSIDGERCERYITLKPKRRQLKGGDGDVP